MAVFWMLLIAGMVWAAVVLVRRSDHTTGPVAVLGPSEILDRRLASGEIDAATYDALRSKLRPAQER
jgi:putative membrane protein